VRVVDASAVGERDGPAKSDQGHREHAGSDPGVAPVKAAVVGDDANDRGRVLAVLGSATVCGWESCGRVALGSAGVEERWLAGP
jgi:hypothetical protein